MKRLVWWFQRHGAAFVFVAGAAMALAAVVMDRVELAPLQVQLQHLQREVPRREAQLVHLDAPAEPVGPSEQLRQFQAFFAQAQTPTEQLRRLDALARQQGLVLDSANYRLEKATRANALDRYQVILPLRGPYPRVRDFMMAALRELPTMAIDQVQLQREAIADTAVEAQVTLTFFVARP
jgi:hypothetical protein